MSSLVLEGLLIWRWTSKKTRSHCFVSKSPKVLVSLILRYSKLSQWSPKQAPNLMPRWEYHLVKDQAISIALVFWETSSGNLRERQEGYKHDRDENLSFQTLGSVWLSWFSSETIGIWKDLNAVVAGDCQTFSFLILCVESTASVLSIIYELQIYPQKVFFFFFQKSGGNAIPIQALSQGLFSKSTSL